jgi:hypothetical protein
MDEIEAVTRVVNKRCMKILKGKNKDRKKKGDIGELFCKYAIKQSLFNLGFRLSRFGNKTFVILDRYRADDDGYHGVDFYVKFRLKWWKTYRCFIEIKNWGNYSYTNDMFHEEILSRFKPNDRLRRRHWILVINCKRIHDVKDNCEFYNIISVPLGVHLTSYYINPFGYFLLQPIMKGLIDSFKEIFEGIIAGEIKQRRFELIKH